MQMLGQVSLNSRKAMKAGLIDVDGHENKKKL